jgi:hypothetical protein
MIGYFRVFPGGKSHFRLGGIGRDRFQKAKLIP